MDNASKALIMAGAILIAVMLISLGVLLYNRAQDVATDSIGTIDSIGVTAFNEQFTQYCGPRVRGSTVKTLIGKVNAAKKAGYTVTLSGVTQAGAVDSSKYYKVLDSAYDSSTGAIKTITISVTT